MAEWCKGCGQPVKRLQGGPLGKVVHAGTGNELGDGGHLAIPVDENPVLRAEADAVEREFGGVFTVSVRFGFFRADVADPGGATYQHWTADTAQDLRRQLAAVAERAERGW
jgi:hypothetical protein